MCSLRKCSLDILPNIYTVGLLKSTKQRVKHKVIRRRRIPDILLYRDYLRVLYRDCCSERLKPWCMFFQPCTCLTDRRKT